MVDSSRSVSHKVYLSPLLSAKLEGKKRLSLTIEGKTHKLSVKTFSIYKWIKAKISPRKHMIIKARDASGKRKKVILRCDTLAKKIKTKRTEEISSKELMQILKSPGHALLPFKRKEIATLKRETRKIRKIAKKHLMAWKLRAEQEGGATHISKAESGAKYGFTVTKSGDIYMHTRIFIGQGGQKKVTFAVNIKTMELKARARIKGDFETTKAEADFYTEFHDIPFIVLGHTVTVYGDGGSSGILLELCSGDLDPFDKRGKFSSPVKDPIKSLMQGAYGLYKMHEKGFAHNDMKNENLFRDMRGNTKVGDPGSSRNIKKTIDKACHALDKLSKIEKKIIAYSNKIRELNEKIEQIKQDPSIKGVVKYTSMKKGFIKKRQDLRNLRLELETNVLTVWSKPPHTPFYISPEFFHDLPAGFLPPKADLRDTTARKQLRKDLNKLMKHKQKMKEFNDYLYKRDVFALAGCIYQYRTKNQFLPWHDHETIIKGALKLAITKLDEKIDACQDPKEKEQLKMERDLLKNDRDKEKIVRELVVHLKRINNLWEEIAELEKKFDKFLEIEMLNANVPIERFQQLKYELLTREDKIYKPEVKALFLNFKNFNKIKGLGKLISDKRYVFKKTEEAIEKGCKQEFGFTPPFKELYRDAIISNLTRSHQEALGYTKPDKTDRLAYLEWRMHDPDPKKRPSMREVYKELRAIHKNK